MRVLTRQQAIDDLRRRLIQMCGERQPMCAVAGKRNIFCRGFRAMSDEQLFARLDWLVERQRPESRAELEDLAERWQLARQDATDRALSCDVQTEERDICLGWDEFDNAELERQYLELRSEMVRIV